jgi:hypothetical protein
MIITLKGANFSASNIGTLTTWRISTTLGAGATSSNSVTSVDRNSNTGYTTTITIAEGYDLGTAGITVTMGGVDITSTAVSGLTITIPTKVTGNVMIKVPTKNVNTGEEDSNYTFTITPDPISATVTLSATGYSTVTGTGSKSITVANGTKVNWSVSADGYTEQNGTWTANGSDESKDVKLVASSGSGEPYWVGEKLSGKAHGTGTASSYLGTQYYYVTDEAAINELSGKTVDKMAFNFASKSGNDTPAGTITVYLINLNNLAPTSWEAKAEIAVEAYPAGSQKEFDITPFTVPTGYTIGYRANKQAILGGGYIMQDYKIGGAYYEDVDATTSKAAQLGGVDIHIQGM